MIRILAMLVFAAALFAVETAEAQIRAVGRAGFSAGRATGRAIGGGGLNSTVIRQRTVVRSRGVGAAAIVAPVYAQPIYSQAIIAQPIYTQAIYAQPIISQPIYAQPIIQGYSTGVGCQALFVR